MLFKHMMLFGLMFFAADGAGGGSGSGESGGDGDTGESGDSGESGDDKSGGDDADGLKSALEKERKAARDANRELKALQKKIADLENAGKSDEEKREADLKAALERAAAAEERAQRTSGQAAIFKATDPRFASAVYALAKDQLEFDDDASPTNVEAVLDDIKKSSPDLFPAARGSADGGKTGINNGYEPSPGVARISHAYEQDSKKK